MVDSQATAQTIVEKRDTFIDRLLQSVAGTFDIFTIYIGDRLGFYRTLADAGPLTSTALANQTGTRERYTREWLEQQTVTGILEVEDATKDAKARRFRLPAGHREVLVESDSLNYLAPLAQVLVGATRPLESILSAYRNGGGVHYSEYGKDLREGQAGINRAMFLKELGPKWIPAMPDVHAGLQTGGRVADVGCGAGWSSIGIAQSYPAVQVDGFDLDAPSIELARTNAAQAGLNGQVTFHVRDIADPHLIGQYDLVTALECVHDLSDPVGALRTMRRCLADENGVVLIMDERVGDTFTGEGGDVEWMMYGWSVLHCLPVGMAEQPSAETGTVMRADTLRHYAAEAGFRTVEILPIENFFFRFYRLNP